MNSTRILTIGAVVILVIILLNLDGPARLKRGEPARPAGRPSGAPAEGAAPEAVQADQTLPPSASNGAPAATSGDSPASDGERTEPTGPDELPVAAPLPSVSPEPEEAPLPPGAIDAVREATRQVIAGAPANAKTAIEFSNQITNTRLYDDERKVVAKIHSENVRSLVVAMEKTPDSPAKRQYARYIFDELRSDPAAGIRDIKQALSVLPPGDFPLSHAAAEEVLHALEAARGDGR